MLSRSVKKEELSSFIISVKELSDKGEKELINSVLEVSTRANKRNFEKYKEEKGMMGPALSELMREEITASENKGRAEGRALILEALVKDGTISAERAKELESKVETQKTNRSGCPGW